MKINQHIEIVCSTEPGLSSMSAPSRTAIKAALSKHFSEVGITIVNTLSDLEELIAKRPDLVFLGMKFIPENPQLGQQDPNKIWISQYLDLHDVAYTGSTHIAHNLELNKDLAKQRAIDAGLATSRFFVAKQGHLETVGTDMVFPLFIKPINRGGGAGIDHLSVAHNLDQMWSKIDSIARELREDSLVEEYLPGREFSVAVLRDRLTGQFSTMPLELIAPPDSQGKRLLSAAVKSADTERSIEVTDLEIRSKLCELALNVFHAIGARDYGRIDIRMDQAGAPKFLEANLIPSLIEGFGNFPKACVMNENLEYEEMILNIANLGLARKPDSSDFEVEHLPLTALVVAEPI